MHRPATFSAIVMLTGFLGHTGLGVDAANRGLGETARAFVEHKLPKVANEYDTLYLDECELGHAWPLAFWKVPAAEYRERVGYAEVVQDESPERGKVIQVTVRRNDFAAKVPGYDFHCQVPSEVDAYTFYAKLGKDTQPIALEVGHDTRRVPGNWFTSWRRTVTVDSTEWRKYVVPFDGTDMAMQHHSRRPGDPGFPTERYSCDYLNEIFFSVCPGASGTFFLDDGGFEDVNGGRRERRTLSAAASKRVTIIQLIEDFEQGLGKLGKNTTQETYLKGNWAMLPSKHVASLNTNDAFSGKQCARILQGPHEQDNTFEVETGPAPGGADAISFHLKAVRWAWMDLVKANQGDARLRHPFYIYSVLWTVPAEEQHRMANAKGNDLYAAEGCRWSLGNKDLVDQDGQRIPRAFYVARVRVDCDRLEEWQQVVIPIRDYTYVWGMDKRMDQPANPKDLFHVGFYAGAKDMFDTTYLVDDLAFAACGE